LLLLNLYVFNRLLFNGFRCGFSFCALGRWFLWRWLFSIWESCAQFCGDRRCDRRRSTFYILTKFFQLGERDFRVDTKLFGYVIYAWKRQLLSPVWGQPQTGQALLLSGTHFELLICCFSCVCLYSIAA
jgi:hypothetical protein